MAKWTKETMTSYIEQEGYTLLSMDGRDSRAKVTLHCGVDGHKPRTMPFAQFSRKDTPYRCPLCKGTEISLEEVKRKAEELGYKYVSGFNNGSISYLNLKCKEGHEFTMRWGNLKKGCRCERCNQSRTEYMIDKSLCYLYGEDKVDFNKTVYYKGHRLRFDFYVDTEESFFVEYDGEQHKTNKFKSDREFQLYQTRDRLKDEYALTNNIPFLRIPSHVYGAEAVIKLLLFTERKLPVNIFSAVVKNGLTRITPQGKDNTYEFKRTVADSLLVKGATIKSVYQEYGINNKRPIEYFRSIYGMGVRDYRDGKLWKQCIID